MRVARRKNWQNMYVKTTQRRHRLKGRNEIVLKLTTRGVMKPQNIDWFVLQGPDYKKILRLSYDVIITYDN